MEAILLRGFSLTIQERRFLGHSKRFFMTGRGHSQIYILLVHEADGILERVAVGWASLYVTRLYDPDGNILLREYLGKNMEINGTRRLCQSTQQFDWVSSSRRIHPLPYDLNTAVSFTHLSGLVNSGKRSTLLY
jgi:hypothetical protein